MKESKYFKVKVKVTYEKANGRLGKRSEEYLVRCGTVTEAEARIYQEFESYPNDWVVASATETKILDVF